MCGSPSRSPSPPSKGTIARFRLRLPSLPQFADNAPVCTVAARLPVVGAILAVLDRGQQVDRISALRLSRRL